jgi:hypothetical protein
LASKDFVSDDGELTEEAQQFIVRTVKTVLDTDGVAYKANYEVGGSVLPAGFTASVMMDTTMPGEQLLEVKDAEGKVILAHKFPAPEAPPAAAAADSADQKEKHDLSQLKARAMSLSTKYETN